MTRSYPYITHIILFDWSKMWVCLVLMASNCFEKFRLAAIKISTWWKTLKKKCRVSPLFIAVKLRHAIQIEMNKKQ
jgi:hypothetical protein